MEIRLSDTAKKVADSLRGKDKSLVLEALRIIAKDPFGSAHTSKLRGEWEGCYRVRKGNWRVIYKRKSDGNIYVIYIRRRDDKTYK